MKNKILTIVFVLLVFGFTLLDLLTPDRAFSEWENRELKGAPEISAKRIFSGEFGTDYENYMTDQFALRDTLVKVKYLADRALLKTDSGGVYIADNALFVKQNEVNADFLNKNISAMEFFAEKYPARFILVPSATYICRDMLPPYASVIDEEALFEGFDFENIEFINILDQMNTDSYFRTDHHWTCDGALVGYNAYRKALGKEELTRDSFVISEVSEDFFGTSTSKSGAVGIKPDTLEKWERGKVLSLEVYNGLEVKEYSSLYFDEYLDKKDKYSYYLGSNQPVVRIKTEGDGGKLLVFKDSYAHIFSQLLVDDYSEIVLVDLRYIKQKVALLLDTLFGMGYEDFDERLFLYSADTFTSESNMLWIK